tara:strand:- start:19215 stop:19646 length:432 start_codon:yes stop_codon:yes gene_type:complete
MSYKKFFLSLSFAALLSGAVSAEDCQCDKPKVKDCDLKVFKEKMAGNESIKVSDDPAGVALESMEDITPALQKYATDNKCQLYVMNLSKLVKGLMKGLKVPGGNETQKSNQEKKYLAMDGKKARCAKELSLKLPIDKYPTEKK